MLRKILIFLGFLIAILPYLGIPYDWSRWIWTFAGLAIVFLVYFSRRGKSVRMEENKENTIKETVSTTEVVEKKIETTIITSPTQSSSSLYVDRIKDTPRQDIHIQRQPVSSVRRTPPRVSSDFVVSHAPKKITPVRRRQRKSIAQVGIASDISLES